MAIRGKSKGKQPKAETPAVKFGDMKLQVVYVPVEKLLPYANNARVHSDDQVAQIAQSIAEFGFNDPVAVNGMSLIEGHGRVMAAQRLNLTHVPAIQLQHMTAAQQRAYMLAHNKIALNSAWDREKLAFELGELKSLGHAEGVNFGEVAGFEAKEIRSLMDSGEPVNPTDSDVDDAPDVGSIKDAPAYTQLGDRYEIGPHMLMCGDSTDRQTVEMIVSKADMPDLLFTDPPYGISVVKSGMVGADFGVAPKGEYAPIIGDETTESAIKCYQLGLALGIPKIILWGGNYFADRLPPSSCWLVWDKRGSSGIVNTFADCELAWTNMTGPSRLHTQLWNGMIREGEREKRVHPTQKPVALCEWAIRNYCNGVVLDLFGGSGSTMVGAHRLGRKCRMMELSPYYCDAIVRRMHKLWPELAVTCNGQPVEWLGDA